MKHLALFALALSALSALQAQNIRVVKFSESDPFRMGEVTSRRIIHPGIGAKKTTLNLSVSQNGAEFAQQETDPLRRWFFDPFVPDRVTVQGREVPWEAVPTDDLARDPAFWALDPERRWHGFSQLAPGYAMTDPNKLTVLTPGFDRATGAYADQGIPAPVVAEYMRENQIVPEKNDLNSLLFLLTPGVESSKAGTLLSAFITFKRLHDDNALLDEIMPDFAARRAPRYKGVRLGDLCRDMHAFYRENDISRLQRDQFRPEHLPVMAMLPHRANRELVRNKVDFLPLDRIQGRIASTLMLVYPPGIPTVLPGERLSEEAGPMLEYLKVFERGANLFPGFDNEIQGVYRKVEPDGRIRFHTYVVRE